MGGVVNAPRRACAYIILIKVIVIVMQNVAITAVCL